MKKQKVVVSLTGCWRLNRRFVTNGSDERHLTLFSGEDFIVGFPAEGIITERCGNNVTSALCHFDPDTNTISIQKTDRTPPSLLSGKSDNIFRVVPLNDNEMYFQRPHSVEDSDPDDEFEVILLEHI